MLIPDSVDIFLVYDDVMHIHLTWIRIINEVISAEIYPDITDFNVFWFYAAL